MADQWSSSCVPCVKDSATLAEVCIDYQHHEIHGGDHFCIASVVDLALNAVFDMQLTTPNTTKWLHFTFQLDCEAETAWYIYEGATISTAGTTITPVNSNRNSATTSTATVAGIENSSVANANLDTAVAGATLIASGIIGAGRSGGASRREQELILKQNTVYCMRAVASAAGYTSFHTEWYEHTNAT